jgi:methionine aminopeptidase
MFEMFVSPVESEGVVQEGLGKLPSANVMWDDELLDNDESHDSLLMLIADEECLISKDTNSVVELEAMREMENQMQCKSGDAPKLVVSECKPKAKIVDLCEKGDAFIREQTRKNVYKNDKRKTERGIAFPTCVSVNTQSSTSQFLKKNDMVKVDMGCHIDGLIAVVAHTHVITNGPVMGRAADVLITAHTTVELAMRLVRSRKKDKDVAEAIQKVVAYDCKIVEGVLSHQLT